MNQAAEPLFSPVKFLVAGTAFLLFALVVFVVQGPEPTLGPDHIVYISQAKSFIAREPGGHYLRDWNSVQSLGVLLAYSYHYTRSHILSLKILLIINTLLFFAAYQLFSSSYIRSFWHRLLFTLISGMAVSFGVASWGVSDYTALLPRTLGAPWIILCFWLYFRFPDDLRRYLAFPALVFASTLHLSAFHAFGVLLATEFLEWIVFDHCRATKKWVRLPASLALSFCLLLFLQSIGASMNVTGFFGWLARPANHSSGAGRVDINGRAISPKVWAFLQSASFMSVITVDDEVENDGDGAVSPAGHRPVLHIVAPAPPPFTAALAWQNELSVRGWRNMPLPFVSVANILSSYFLIGSLAVLGALGAWRRGLTMWDRRMLLFSGAIVLCAFGLQTTLWILRQFTEIYPFNIEEVRALSFLMIPSLYFTYALFLYGMPTLHRLPTTRWRAGVCILAVILPLAMKSLNRPARERILDVLAWAGSVDKGNENSVQNARLSLGLAQGPRYYYDTRGMAKWIGNNLPADAIILSDRDDLLDGHFAVIGTRQQAALANPAQNPQWIRGLFLETARAMASHSSSSVLTAAKEMGATYAIVDWPDPQAIYSDPNFSVLKVP